MDLATEFRSMFAAMARYEGGRLVVLRDAPVRLRIIADWIDDNMQDVPIALDIARAIREVPVRQVFIGAGDTSIGASFGPETIARHTRYEPFPGVTVYGHWSGHSAGMMIVVADLIFETIG